MYTFRMKLIDDLDSFRPMIACILNSNVFIGLFLRSSFHCVGTYYYVIIFFTIFPSIANCAATLWRALILVDWKICWKREVKDTTTEKSETHALWNDVRNVVDDYYIYYYELVPKSKKEKNWVVGAAVPQWSNLLLCWMLSDGCCSTVLKLRWKEVGWICLPLTF